MRAHMKIGRYFGIEVGIHYTWLVIAALITFALSSHFLRAHPQWPSTIVFITALSTALLFFVTLVLHELSHCLVARAYGIPVRSITLFALGGVSNIEGEASSAKAEFWMGIIGPITSLAIGSLCLIAASALGWTADERAAGPFASALAWLGHINVFLAFFNMIPGFPLDGGRVLKAIVWWFTKDRDKSILVAAYTGWVVAMLFIFGGIVLAFAFGSFNGLWLALIGWFLTSVAEAAAVETRLRTSLRNIRAADAMSHDWPIVSGELPLDDFVKEQLSITGKRFIVVQDPANNEMIGIITPHEVTKVPPEQWPETTVRNAMKPIDSAVTTTPDAPVVDALQKMVAQDINQLPVMKGDNVVGILTRADIIELFRTRTELGDRAA